MASGVSRLVQERSFRQRKGEITMNRRRALLVGIDKYQHGTGLTGCEADAQAMSNLLQFNENKSPNYDCHLVTNTEDSPVTRKALRGYWDDLFGNDLDDNPDDILFYFSGHGTPTKAGGFLVTYDGEDGDPGLPMDELLKLADKSKARSILLILDCCYSGHLGNPAILQGSLENRAYLREGITILAASRPTESAVEVEGFGVFTKLVLGALSGGAADVRGRVSAASIYAYVEQALGAWEQRPLYKSHADHLPPVRLCEPAVSDDLLRELPKIFQSAHSLFSMAPSFEYTDPSANPAHVAFFDKFKQLRNASLLLTEEKKDLYFVALESKSVKLSPLGQFYWNLAKKGRI
jgi:Caspase domain